MENGHDGKLAEKFSGLAVNQHNQHHQPHDQSNSSSNNNDSLYQVMKAVEAAEATIKQQVEENNWLRSELQRQIQELEKYKKDEPMDSRSHPVASWNEQGHGSYEAHQSVQSAHDQEDMFKAKSKTRSNAEGRSEDSKMNGSLRGHLSNQLLSDNTGISLFSSLSTRSISPSRHLTEGDHDHGLNLSGQGLMPVAEMNNSNSLWKQEEEIMQLRRQLADYSNKEAQIRNEKYVLEKRIAYMRLAFDQQQQDLVDAASKALSYRQDIIEENIRLTYALQDVHQERSTFVSSLLPLLAEYSLQPPALDAQSIVSNVKVLFKHLQEKLLLTESKLKESQYQLTPWRSDLNHVNIAPQSPSHSVGAAVKTSNKNDLELVPQPGYQVKTPVSVDGQTGPDWDILSRRQSGLGGAATKNADELRRYSPLASRKASTQDMPTQLVVSHDDAHPARYGEEMTNRQVKFRDPVSNSEVDDPDGDGTQNERDSSVHWNSGNSPYTTTVDDPSSSYSPYLPPVLEEPSSSFSEAADDDPLPAIEGLQISGEAFPGKALQACGYSINGTTSCNFEWIRHSEDGSFYYIDGARQPNYLVTADDVDKYLAIEVQPLDDRKRKGEPEKVFANDGKKITCDLEMQNHIEKTFTSGHATYKVSVSIGYESKWESAILAIKREGYNIKCSGPSGVLITEKFSSSTAVVIPYGSVSEFVIIGSTGIEHLLQAEGNTADVSSSRDTIVLTLRLFIRRAVERKRGKKKGLFFNK